MADIWKILISIVVGLFMLLLLRINNCKKTKRASQYPFPIIAMLVSVAETVLYIVFRNRLLNWLGQLPWINTIIQSLLQNGFVLDGIEILVVNFVFVLVYFILKLLFRPFVASITKHLMSPCSRWYEYSEDVFYWVLRENFVGLRSVLHTFSWVIALITTAVCAVAWVVGTGSDFYFTVFPASALIIIYECYIFLAGCTKEEYEQSIDGDNAKSFIHSRYNKLKQVYEKLFPDAILSSRVGKDFIPHYGSAELLKELSESDDKIDRFVGNYYLHLHHRKPGEYNLDLINASNKLLHHESTIIFDPFYNDLSDYLTLPLVDALLAGKKCLVIVGRQSIKDPIAAWINKMLNAYCRTDRLWKVAAMDEEAPECDVGILAFSDLYNLKIVESGTEFFHNTGFVLLMEPSRMLTTSQTGLGIVIGKFDQSNVPVFCACDHESDGLVDLLSHIFKQNVTNVIAAPAIQPIYAAIGWDASGDYKRHSMFQQQTRYLGNGTELAAVALKYQIPQVSWFSEEKAPVMDIRWIAEQYYAQISRYAGTPFQQKSVEDRINFSCNLWESPVTDNSFIIAEDEACNMFATMRAYLSRGRRQSFVNVFSENYLLRDYMRSNWQLFMSDAKAIPTFSPHYAKTERNVVLRLIILMASRPLNEKYIEQELQLLGFETEEMYQQTEYVKPSSSSVSRGSNEQRKTENVYQALSKLIARYTNVTDTIITVQNMKEPNDGVPIQNLVYSINKRHFDLYFSDTLKNASFVVEDEELGKRFIDARMFEHITQIVMPGQQVIYGGKMYIVHTVTPQIGCVLHRAADQYMSRLYYRQLREYMMLKMNKDKDNIVSQRKIGDIEVIIQNRDFEVSSTGYIEMKDQHDLSTAKVVDLSNDPSIGNYKRRYKHKAVLKIVLPGADSNLRYTLCVLISEIMHTLYPYSWPYIAVICGKPDDLSPIMDRYAYSLQGDFDPAAIYVLEDSDMDLGLLESVYDNIFRIFEIVTDYLNWNNEMLEGVHAKEPKRISDEMIRRINELSGDLGILLDGSKKQNEDKPGKNSEGKKGKSEEPVKDGATAASNGQSGASNAPENANETPKQKKKREKREKDEQKKLEKEKRKAEKEKKKAEKKKRKGKKDPDDTSSSTETGTDKAEESPEKKKHGFGQFIRSIFKKKKNAAETNETNENGEVTKNEQPSKDSSQAAESDLSDNSVVTDNEKEHVDAQDTSTGESESDQKEENETLPIDDSDENVHGDLHASIKNFSSTGIFDNLDEQMEDEDTDRIIELFSDDDYRRKAYLNFGFEQPDKALAVDQLLSYLNGLGMKDNSLFAARNCADSTSMDIELDAECQCDFCGMPLNGVSYEKLSDGRIRCHSCSASAVNSVDEFTDVFQSTVQLLEENFNIAFKVPITIRISDAKTIGHLSGHVFKASSGYDPRVVGFAQRKGKDYTLYVENGSPRLATIATVAHEMTHIWQYLNWNTKQVKRAYKNKKVRDIIYEGMASWVEVQILYMIGEYNYAQEQEKILLKRAENPDDVYGIGFVLFCERYGLDRQGEVPESTPYNTFPPI